MTGERSHKQGEPGGSRLGKSRPGWLRKLNETRPKSFRDDAPLTGCAFCEALNRALDDGSGTPGREVDSERLALRVDLDALEREHGECSCL